MKICACNESGRIIALIIAKIWLNAGFNTHVCQGQTESTSVAAVKTHQFEGWREWWFGFRQGEREGDLPLAIALSF